MSIWLQSKISMAEHNVFFMEGECNIYSLGAWPILCYKYDFILIATLVTGVVKNSYSGLSKFHFYMHVFSS